MEQPVIISCDWLSFSVLLPLTDEERAHGIQLSTPSGYSLIEQTGTNIYKKRYILYDAKGNKTLTLLHTPHSKVIAHNSMFVEISNRLLYSQFDPLPLIAQIHEYSFQSVSRIDICADFSPTLRQEEVIEGLQAGSIYAVGKREGAMFHTYEIPQGAGRQRRIAKSMSWGSKFSDVKWKLYNKTLEIFETTPDGIIWCNKPYIPAMWAQNGIKDPNHVWRLECSIMGAASYNWRGEKIGWDTAHQPTNYTALFWDMYANRFKLHLNQGHAAKRYDAEVELLPTPPPPHYRIKKNEPRAEQHHTDHAVTLRALMKELDRDEVRTYPVLAKKLLTATEETIKLANLNGYFLRCYGRPWGKWKIEYIIANNLRN